MGEQAGMVYNPYNDKYFPDPRLVRQQNIDNGFAKKPPSLAQQLAPALIATAGVAAAKGIGDAIPGSISTGLSKIGGLFGLGSPAADTTGTALATGGGGGAGVAGAGQAGLSAPELVGANYAPVADGVAPLSSGGLFGIGALPAAAIAGATYLGGKSAWDMLNGNKDNSIPGMIGRGTLGIATGGLSELARPFLGNQDRWKTEGNALLGLSKSGTYVPQNLLDDAGARTSGRSKAELIQEAQQPGGNSAFANSRNESDLKGIDIANYAAFAKNDPGWFNKSVADRSAFAQKALDAGAVREHNGTIDVDWNKIQQPQAQPQNPVLAVPAGTTPQGLLAIGKR